jgi:hypothetical protein
VATNDAVTASSPEANAARGPSRQGTGAL